MGTHLETSTELSRAPRRPLNLSPFSQTLPQPAAVSRHSFALLLQSPGAELPALHFALGLFVIPPCGRKAEEPRVPRQQGGREQARRRRGEAR